MGYPLLKEFTGRELEALILNLSSQLPPREWLYKLDKVMNRFRSTTEGNYCVYLALLYHVHGQNKYGIYVGQTRKDPRDRYQDHKAAFNLGKNR